MQLSHSKSKVNLNFDYRSKVIFLFFCFLCLKNNQMLNVHLVFPDSTVLVERFNSLEPAYFLSLQLSLLPLLQTLSPALHHSSSPLQSLLHTNCKASSCYPLPPPPAPLSSPSGRHRAGPQAQTVTGPVPWQTA